MGRKGRGKDNYWDSEQADVDQQLMEDDEEPPKKNAQKAPEKPPESSKTSPKEEESSTKKKQNKKENKKEPEKDKKSGGAEQNKKQQEPKKEGKAPENGDAKKTEPSPKLTKSQETPAEAKGKGKDKKAVGSVAKGKQAPPQKGSSSKKYQQMEPVVADDEEEEGGDEEDEEGEEEIEDKQQEKAVDNNHKPVNEPKIDTKQEILPGLDEERKGSESMSNDIKVEKFDISFGSKQLFKDATLTLAHGRKYGLVAPNGTGKSTLLKHIANRDDKFIEIPKHFLILYVEQEVVGDDTPALQSVINADTERLKLLAEEKRLMESNDFDSAAADRLSYIHSRLDQIEAYSAEARASSILSGLQFTEDMKLKATKDFSGGWRMRIALARALFCRPTLLLLDEPTNHLDLLAVIWLETYLRKWKATLLVVSHDQDFLNSVCTDVIHIYQEKLDYYKGNYDSFKKSFEDMVSIRRKAYEKQKKLLDQAKREKSKKDTKKATEKASRDVKVIRNKALNEKSKKKHQDDEAAADQAKKELLEMVPRDYTVHFDFPDPEPLSIPIIQVADASFSYDPDSREPLFTGLNFGVDLESKIALVGPNGAGKSTLLKLLAGELQPTSGTVTRNRKLVIGRFTQHFIDKLDMTKTPIDYLQTKFPEYQTHEIRQMLGRFGLTGKTQLQLMPSLSGGQKSRVVLADIGMTYPHILFLDEPTNHLDIESIDALAEALLDYTGGLVLVSHDARLINQVCNQIWIVGDNTVTIYGGDFDDYRNELVEEMEERLVAEEEERKQKEEERRKKREQEMQEKLARQKK